MTQLQWLKGGILGGMSVFFPTLALTQSLDLPASPSVLSPVLLPVPGQLPRTIQPLNPDSELPPPPQLITPNLSSNLAVSPGLTQPQAPLSPSQVDFPQQRSFYRVEIVDHHPGLLRRVKQIEPLALLRVSDRRIQAGTFITWNTAQER